MTGAVLICAGGTGGHLFPAEALARALKARGWSVHLATDHRVDAYARDFPGRGDPHHPVGDDHPEPGRGGARLPASSAGLLGGAPADQGSRSPPSRSASAAIRPCRRCSRRRGRRCRPSSMTRTRCSVGRTSFLATRMTAIATAVRRGEGRGGFRRPGGRDRQSGPRRGPARRRSTALSGTPAPAIRSAFSSSAAARAPASSPTCCRRRLQCCPTTCASRLRITQQCRPEDLDRVAAGLPGDRRRGRAPGRSSTTCRPASRQPSGGRAVRRLDRRRALGDRPAGHHGAASPCPRSGPEGQCRDPGAGRRRLDGRAARHDARSGSRRISAN